MNRMLDIVRAGGLYVPAGATAQDRDTLASLADDMGKATALLIDNVTAYVAAHPLRTLADVPTIRPPFPATWVETGWPAGMVSDAAVTRMGWLVRATEEPDGLWLHVAQIGFAPSRRASPNFLHRLKLPIDPSGRMSEDRKVGFWLLDAHAAHTATALAQHQVTVDGRTVFNVHSLSPLLLALAFTHCRNVAITEQRPPRAARRAAEQAGRPAPVTYRVLDIGPMRHVLSAEGRVGEVGLPKALHICRGHFATYDERPLFGKHKGTFWVPAHVRGTPDRGVVVKDYRVHPPTEAP